jgi:hypothetical protein
MMRPEAQAHYWPEYDTPGLTSSDPESRSLDLRNVITVVMGPMAAGEPVPTWKPRADARPGSDEAGLAALVEFLELTRGGHRKRAVLGSYPPPPVGCK